MSTSLECRNLRRILIKDAQRKFMAGDDEPTIVGEQNVSAQIIIGATNVCPRGTVKLHDMRGGAAIITRSYKDGVCAGFILDISQGSECVRSSWIVSPH